MFQIEQVTRATQELSESMAGLLPLLSSAPPPSLAELQQIVSSPCSRLLVAREGPGGPVVGCLTLGVFRAPTGLRAWIEDVVVAESARGKGCGEALTRHALALASGLGARTVELTSRPSREAANRLYQRIGFVKRETNVYRYSL